MIWSYFSTSFSALMSPSIRRFTAAFIFSRATAKGISSTAWTPWAVSCLVSNAICCWSVTTSVLSLGDDGGVKDDDDIANDALDKDLSPSCWGSCSASGASGGCWPLSCFFFFFSALLLASSWSLAPVPAGRRTKSQRSSSPSGRSASALGSRARRMPASFSSWRPFKSSGTLPMTVRRVVRALRMSAFIQAPTATSARSSSRGWWSSSSLRVSPPREPPELLRRDRRCFIASSRRAALEASMILCSRKTVFHFSMARYEKRKVHRFKMRFVKCSFSMAFLTPAETLSRLAAAPRRLSTA
mmetsp:Transcript_23511/g.75443  ORF Transcript_23511/g.75443 Transcript_23511/m.75443 type:complete len:300 (+) Transcript_23511:1313-2212(+)